MRITDPRCDSCPVEQDRDFLSGTCPHMDQRDCLIRDRELIEKIKRGESLPPLPKGQGLILVDSKKEVPFYKKPRRRNKRPEIMPEPKGYYIHGDKYPDTVRISFEDGHTEIYDRRVSQPSPAGYVNNSRRGKP